MESVRTNNVMIESFRERNQKLVQRMKKKKLESLTVEAKWNDRFGCSFKQFSSFVDLSKKLKEMNTFGNQKPAHLRAISEKYQIHELEELPETLNMSPSDCMIRGSLKRANSILGSTSRKVSQKIQDQNIETARSMREHIAKDFLQDDRRKGSHTERQGKQVFDFIDEEYKHEQEKILKAKRYGLKDFNELAEAHHSSWKSQSILITLDLARQKMELVEKTQVNNPLKELRIFQDRSGKLLRQLRNKHKLKPTKKKELAKKQASLLELPEVPDAIKNLHNSISPMPTTLPGSPLLARSASTLAGLDAFEIKNKLKLNLKQLDPNLPSLNSPNGSFWITGSKSGRDPQGSNMESPTSFRRQSSVFGDQYHQLVDQIDSIRQDQQESRLMMSSHEIKEHSEKLAKLSDQFERRAIPECLFISVQDKRKFLDDRISQLRLTKKSTIRQALFSKAK